MCESIKRALCIALSLLVLGALLLAGCGPTPTPAPTKPPAPTPTPVPATPVPTKPPATLTFFTALGEEEWRVMRADIFPPFEKANNVKINGVQVESADAIKKLEAMAKAGKMEVDLIAQDNMQLAPLVDKGLVEDLSAYKVKIPSGVNPALVAVGEFAGKLYFLPYRPNVEIAFYNEKAFAKYGLKPPKTWDELLAVAKAFKEKEGIGRVTEKFTLDGNTTVILFDYIRAAGGDPMTLNDEGSIKAYTFLKQLWPYLSPDAKTANWDTTNKYLLTEASYLGRNWPFGVNVIVKDGKKTEIKAYSGWTGPQGEFHIVGGEVIGVPTGSPNKDLALKFWEYLVSKEAQETLVSKMGWPAVRADAYGTVEEWQKPYFAAVNDALKYGHFRPNITWWADLDKALNDAAREIIVEGKDVKATLDKYHAVIEAAKKKAGG